MLQVNVLLCLPVRLNVTFVLILIQVDKMTISVCLKGFTHPSSKNFTVFKQ